MQKSGTLTGCNPLGIARAEKSPLFENNQIDLDALKVERDENDQRKPPTTSERVDLARAIEAHEKWLAEQRMKAGVQPSGNISLGSGAGQVRDILAQKVGLDIRELVEAMARVPPRSPMDRVPLGLSD